MKTLAVPAVGHDVDGAVGFHAGNAAVVSLAHQQAPLQVQGHAVGAPAGFADDFGRSAGRRHPVYHRRLAPQVNEQPVAVGMPQRAFGKGEVGGQLLRFLVGFDDAGQIFGHGLPPLVEGDVGMDVQDAI